MMETLTLRFAGPLQSFGNETAFSRRTTNYYPTKSAVIGMIAAALGYRRNNSKIKDLNNLHFGVRIDQPGKIMTEFQIARFGKKPKELERTYRYFLQDAVFVIGIAANDKRINKIQTAIKHPKFQLFLGRRASVPDTLSLMNTQVFEDGLIHVLRHIPWEASNWYKKKVRNKPFTAYIYADADLVPEKNNFMVKDKVGSFDQRDRFHKYRPIVKETVELYNNAYEKDTCHDAFSSI